MLLPVASSMADPLIRRSQQGGLRVRSGGWGHVDGGRRTVMDLIALLSTLLSPFAAVPLVPCQARPPLLSGAPVRLRRADGSADQRPRSSETKQRGPQEGAGHHFGDFFVVSAMVFAHAAGLGGCNDSASSLVRLGERCRKVGRGDDGAGSARKYPGPGSGRRDWIPVERAGD